MLPGELAAGYFFFNYFFLYRIFALTSATDATHYFYFNLSCLTERLIVVVSIASHSYCDLACSFFLMTFPWYIYFLFYYFFIVDNICFISLFTLPGELYILSL